MSDFTKTRRVPNVKRLNSLAAAHEGRRRAAKERVRALAVPAPFQGVDDFLAALGEVSARGGHGTVAEIAHVAGVSTSTVSKYLGGKKRPSQEKLDGLVKWWRVNRDQSSAPKPASHKLAKLRGAPERRAPAVMARLPAPISDRLALAARLRNVTAITLAAQILDRHLPTKERLDAERTK